jgi:uncharacterized protein involved in outer membrane biogenesis
MQGKKTKKWLLVAGGVALLFVAGFFTFSFFAVRLIEPELQKAIGPGFTLAEIEVKATHLSAKGIQYNDPHSGQKFLQVEEMRVYPALFSLVKGPLHIREVTLVQPSFFFDRTREGIFMGPWAMREEREKDEEKKQEIPGEGEKKESLRVKIDRIRIKKGSVDFDDWKVGDPPAEIRLRDLDLNIEDIHYPMVSTHSPVELTGKMKGRMRDSDIDINGWIDLKTADMDTFFRVRGIEVKLFEPYYRKKVSAEIDSGYVNMESEIALKERRVDAPGELELVDMDLREGGGTVFWIPARTLVTLLKDRGGRLKLRFHVEGNLDDPRFNLQESLLTRIAVAFLEASGIPIKGVGETILKGTGKGAEGLSEGLKSIEELLTKKKGKRR